MGTNSVLIVGAGPTGLVLALYLAHHKIPVRVIEKNSGQGLASRAMAVQARTLELYNQLGFADAIVEQGIKIGGVHFRVEAEELAHFSLAEMGTDVSPFPFMLSYPQDEHEKFLAARLKTADIEIEYDTELLRFTQDKNSVHATIKKSNGKSTIKNGGEEVIECSYLCGCDGARSRVREQLQIDFPGGTYSQIFYVADVELEGNKTTDAVMNMGPQLFVMKLPVRNRASQRLIGIVPPELNAEASTIRFEDVQKPAERLLGVKVKGVNWFSTYHVHHRVTAKFRVGRCFLAGDAGHIHSPVGGQGMNTGIGDAINLSWKIAQVLQGRANESLLDTYETERIAFAKSLVSTTDKIFQSVIRQGFLGRWTRTIFLPHFLRAVSQFAFMRRFVFSVVSQTKINYRQSSISQGRAGKVRGGDRLPWLPIETGGDNFKSLSFMDWQLHVYGRPDAPIRQSAEKLQIPIQTYAWSARAAKAGFEENAAYLIRPDGYVAVCLPRQEVDPLQQFFKAIRETQARESRA